jgi:uncharacterized damage-inducible protein DinB
VNAQDLLALFDYHYWARDRLLDALEPLTPQQFSRDMGSSFRSIRETAAHIYAAEWAWYSRWRGESPTALVGAEMFPDVATLRAAWNDLERDVRAFLSNRDEEGLREVLAYKLISGQPGASILWQMAQHVVNHATYHRGQIVTMLRQLGATPPKPMDLIAFYRLRGG